MCCPRSFGRGLGSSWSVRTRWPRTVCRARPVTWMSGSIRPPTTPTECGRRCLSSARRSPRSPSRSGISRFRDRWSRWACPRSESISSLAWTGVDFETAWMERVVHRVDTLDLPFMGREALLRNKRATGRTKDLADVEILGATEGWCLVVRSRSVAEALRLLSAAAPCRSSRRSSCGAPPSVSYRKLPGTFAGSASSSERVMATLSRAPLNSNTPVYRSETCVPVSRPTSKVSARE